MTDSIGLGTLDVLDACQAVVMSCAELYHHFAELFKDDRETLLFWLKIALEEENHAKLFGLIGKLKNKNIIGKIRLELIDAEISLLYVRSLINRVKKCPPSIEEALRIAIDLEKKMDNFVIDKVVVFADNSSEKLFQAMRGPDCKHLQSLQKAYDRIILGKQMRS